MALRSDIAAKLTRCLHVYIAPTPPFGFGIFSARPRKKGEVIVVDEEGDYFERALSYRELVARGYDVHDDVLQVGTDAFVPATGTVDDLINHSCTPNCGVKLTPNGYLVVALRHIARDEQLTYDYSTFMTTDYGEMVCLCGSPECRGRIAGFETLPLKLRRKYVALGIVGAFAAEAAGMKPRPHVWREPAREPAVAEVGVTTAAE